MAVALFGGCLQSERLEPTYVELDDGAMQFRSWFDAARGVGCDITDEEGEIACRPRLTSYEGLMTFTDDACEVREDLAFYTPVTNPDPTAVASSGGSLRHIEDIVIPFILTPDEQCVRRTQFPGYRIGAPIEPPEPAAADGVNITAAKQFREGERLRARRLVAEDGAQLFLGWYDTGLDVGCEVQERDGVRCWPDAAHVIYRFTIPDCSRETALVLDRAEGEFATDGFRYFRIGDPYVGPIYGIEEGVCVQRLVTGFRQTTIVDPSIFVSEVVP